MAATPGVIHKPISILARHHVFPHTLAMCIPANIDTFQYRRYNPDNPEVQRWALRTDQAGKIHPFGDESRSIPGGPRFFARDDKERWERLAGRPLAAWAARKGLTIPHGMVLLQYGETAYTLQTEIPTPIERFNKSMLWLQRNMLVKMPLQEFLEREDLDSYLAARLQESTTQNGRSAKDPAV